MYLKWSGGCSPRILQYFHLRIPRPRVCCLSNHTHRSGYSKPRSEGILPTFVGKCLKGGGFWSLWFLVVSTADALRIRGLVEPIYTYVSDRWLTCLAWLYYSNVMVWTAWIALLITMNTKTWRLRWPYTVHFWWMVWHEQSLVRGNYGKGLTHNSSRLKKERKGVTHKSRGSVMIRKVLEEEYLVAIYLISL